MYYTLQGRWTAEIGDGKTYPMELLGTLDENHIGHRDTGANQWHPDGNLGNGNGTSGTGIIETRFTRKYTYEGEARLTRKLEGELWESLEKSVADGKRIFLEAERARVLRLLMDGKEVLPVKESSISTPWVFEVTGLLRKGSILTLLSDNSYPGLPHDDIVYSSAATDETQTNWNGVLGRLGFRTENRVFLDNVRVYPCGKFLTVKMDVYADVPWEGTVRVFSEALQGEARQRVKIPEGVTEVVFENLPLAEHVHFWDLEEGNLYRLSVSLADGEERTVSFGVRQFGDDGQGRLALNGRRIFLRGEVNCGEFPETGHPPMTVEEWKEILERYRSYGVNCVRFHSYCPPEAAFVAADQMGMLIQPELSHWNPRDAFESEESCHYYTVELMRILEMLANHPSFVMLSFGNELHATARGHKRMRHLLDLARRTDPTRLYTDASNGHYGMNGCEEAADFYTSACFRGWKLRGTDAGMEGHINQCYPDARSNYDESIKKLRGEYGKPVFSFEVGQFEVLPDFNELEQFHGISDPANLRVIRDRAWEQGLQTVWKKYVEATGEISRIGYREEVEATMRTRELSGISLLGLQDFPGQGTALVGMMNSHLQPKPYEFARPEHFRSFFRDQLPLVMLPRYTWESTEILRAEVLMANYGKAGISGMPEYRLEVQPSGAAGYSCAGGQPGNRVLMCGKLPETVCPAGMLTGLGCLEIHLEELEVEEPVRLNLIVRLKESENLYPVWVYPPVRPQCPEDVYETAYLDDKAKEILTAGGKVYLSPPSTKEALPFSIQAQFTTDFWSVKTFAVQEGGMGQLIDREHHLFDRFPTEFHTNWQWWPMAVQRAVILPENQRAIITEMDSYAFLRPMAQLLECRCGGGRLLFSTLGLQNLLQYPEARALQDSIYRYMDSEYFQPDQTMELSVLEKLVRPVPAGAGDL